MNPCYSRDKDTMLSWCNLDYQDFIDSHDESEYKLRFLKADYTLIAKLAITTYSYPDVCCRATELEVVMFRMGILAVLRSKAKSAAIGVMITASHNPVDDNGVKLIDPHGDMLDSSWENLATDLANANDEELNEVVQKIVAITQLDAKAASKVFCAYDTRPSSIGLHEAVKVGVTFAGGSLYTSYGILTTPQLHYMVRAYNTNSQYGIPTEEGYYSKIATAFKILNADFPPNLADPLFVDAANGVGGLALKKLLDYAGDQLTVVMVNSDEGPLNDGCGADYVKVEQNVPKIYTPNVVFRPLARWASFDGDADRLVYFYLDEGYSFRLLDGDKIAALFAGYIGDLLVGAKISDVQMGVVQTAYANGNSTKYIETVLKIPTFCVPTGVKYLHKQAESLDIGVYFEANGHGTVLFSDKAKLSLKAIVLDENAKEQCKNSACQLLMFIGLINETVGDAIADLLAVETILKYRKWSIVNWSSIYTDLPNRQMKVKVADRKVVQTTDAERICSLPLGLQDGINELASKYVSGRAFVRPSGTEDVVRVYAEADTQDNANRLATEIASVVFDLAGGVGEKPILT